MKFSLKQNIGHFPQSPADNALAATTLHKAINQRKAIIGLSIMLRVTIDDKRCSAWCQLIAQRHNIRCR
ncbi:hypothetical protein ATN89_18565 [Comamonas thiooxydans]|nr:hypothetical protein ATN89_18565 [Comamonas thiooxydans]